MSTTNKSLGVRWSGSLRNRGHWNSSGPRGGASGDDTPFVDLGAPGQCFRFWVSLLSRDNTFAGFGADGHGKKPAWEIVSHPRFVTSDKETRNPQRHRDSLQQAGSKTGGTATSVAFKEASLSLEVKRAFVDPRAGVIAELCANRWRGSARVAARCCVEANRRFCTAAVGVIYLHASVEQQVARTRLTATGALDDGRSGQDVCAIAGRAVPALSRNRRSGGGNR
ncbi:hypothetical protein FQR65_LT20312 [Abscondita terminalis]|nr:hypothetical protein FQR65_LT20312 [Abscondita terminalis]